MRHFFHISFAFFSYFFQVYFAFHSHFHFKNISQRPHLKCKTNVSKQCFLNISIGITLWPAGQLWFHQENKTVLFSSWSHLLGQTGKNEKSKKISTTILSSAVWSRNKKWILEFSWVIRRPSNTGMNNCQIGQMMSVGQNN